MLTLWFVDIVMCQHCDLSTLWCVDIVMCQHCDVSTLWCVDIVMCQHCDVSTLWCVDIVMGRHCYLSTLLLVDIVTCRHCDLSTFSLHPSASSWRKCTLFLFIRPELRRGERESITLPFTYQEQGFSPSIMIYTLGSLVKLLKVWLFALLFKYTLCVIQLLTYKDFRMKNKWFWDTVEAA